MLKEREWALKQGYMFAYFLGAWVLNRNAPSRERLRQGAQTRGSSPALPLPAVCSPERVYPFHVSVSCHVTWDDADVDMKLPTQGLFFIKHRTGSDT